MLRIVTYLGSSRFRRPQSIHFYPQFFSTDALQLGRRLTPEEIAARRDERLQRRAATGEDTTRSEMRDALFIEGSVRYYQRHYVIVEPEDTDPNAWSARLEQSPKHILSRYMTALKDLYGGDSTMAKTSPLLVTAAIPYFGMYTGTLQKNGELPTGRREEGAHDILVFPDSLRVHNVVPSQISMLVSKSMEKKLEIEAMLKQGNMQYMRMEKAYHMLVCSHTTRDERCGCMGPKLLQWLKNMAPDAKKPLNLWISSHYGGHRYAANCIVYPRGDWFGLLNDEEKAQNMFGAVNDEDSLRVYEVWRGRLGLTVQEMLQAVKERISG